MQTAHLSTRPSFKHTFELWIFSGSDIMAEVSRMREWEKGDPDTWTVLRRSSFFLLHPCTDMISNIIVQTVHSYVIWTTFFSLCKHLPTKTASTLQHLFLFFIASSHPDPHSYLTAVFFFSSQAYITTIAQWIIAVFTTCPPLPHMPMAFLSGQSNSHILVRTLLGTSLSEVAVLLLIFFPCLFECMNKLGELKFLGLSAEVFSLFSHSFSVLWEAFSWRY